MKAPGIDAAVERIDGGDPQPLYLVIGEQVLATREATRIADALAAGAGCEAVVHKAAAGADLPAILRDLFTYSLFESAKVALVVGSAALSDENAAADLIDEAARALGDGYHPAGGAGEALTLSERSAAGRLLQTLRLFGIDPLVGAAEDVISSLPDSALAGGRELRKGGRRGRLKKDRTSLAAGLAALLDAARAEDLSGWSDEVVADLDRVAGGGLPERHALVFAERSVDRKHPLVDRLFKRNAAFEVAQLGFDRNGRVTGVEPVVAALERETGVRIDRAAAMELARRTLRKEGWGASAADAASAARFAAEYRKLAAGAHGVSDRIDRATVEESVVDRGEQDVWAVLTAMEAGKPREALAALRRYLDNASDRGRARFSFLNLLAGRCQQLVTVHGIAMACGLPVARNYNAFRARVLPQLMSEWPGGAKKPAPYPLFNTYRAAMMRRGPEAVAAMSELAWKVLETEYRLRGGTGDDTAALEALVLAAAGAGLPQGGGARSPEPRGGFRGAARPGGVRSARGRARRRAG